MSDPFQGDKKTQKNTLIDSLLPGLNNVLGVRDTIGAKVREVYKLTRTWAGRSIGEGDYTDQIVQVLPSPYLVDYSHSIMLQAGGSMRSGDIIIKNISKAAYPSESDVDGRVDQTTLNVEHFYFINNLHYTVIHVKDNYLVWDVHVRKVTDEGNKVSP